jgi:hypothetical protein
MKLLVKKGNMDTWILIIVIIVFVLLFLAALNQKVFTILGFG